MTAEKVISEWEAVKRRAVQHERSKPGGRLLTPDGDYLRAPNAARAAYDRRWLVWLLAVQAEADHAAGYACENPCESCCGYGLAAEDVARVAPTRVAWVDAYGRPWAEYARVDGLDRGYGPIDRPGRRHGAPEHDPLPDLFDPATLGAIEHDLLPKAWGPECAITLTVDVLLDGSWEGAIGVWNGDLSTPSFSSRWTAPTRVELIAELLIQAMEAAPMTDLRRPEPCTRGQP